MKSLLLSIVVFLSLSCGAARVDSELITPLSQDTETILDHAMVVFKINKALYKKEIILGKMCVASIGDVNQCNAFRTARIETQEMTDAGVVLFLKLNKMGILTITHPRFPEFETIAKEMIELSKESQALEEYIETSITGSKCIRCLI